MNFLSIEYFAAVASEHSFSKAAKRLGITQQTLSANIAALERELGCTLFVRHVPLELTYAGTVFARYAQRFRRDRDALGQEMRDIAGDQAGVLRVGVAYTRSRAIMPPIVKAMQRDCPNIIVELIEGRNDQIQQWLANGDLDLAVADLSFISLTKILPIFAPNESSLLKPNGHILMLVKPQFELDAEALSKAGIVKDPARYSEVQSNIIQACLAQHLTILDYFESPITGTDGNREFFVFAQFQPDSIIDIKETS